MPVWLFYNGFEFLTRYFVVKKLKLCRIRPRPDALTLTRAHTKDKDHMVTDLLIVISATSAFSTVGQQILLDDCQILPL